VWRVTSPAAVLSSPAVANGVVYVGMTNNIVAWNAATGALLWMAQMIRPDSIF
jgi:outer membrane protein assembly factor BamB